MRRPIRALLVLVPAALAGGGWADALAGEPAATGGAAAARAEYERLLEWRFEAQERPVPAGGLVLRGDAAEWRLESGELWLAEPLSDGSATGLVFAGEGVFRMEIPDPIERAQLRRFAGDPELEALETGFGRLVLRTSDPRLVRDLAGEPRAPFKPHKLARARHDFWLRIHRQDADAAVVAARHDGRPDYLRVEVDSDEHGWLVWELDPRRPEEIRLERFSPSFDLVESWVSLDREADRAPDGRPGRPPAPPLDVERAEARVRMVKLGKDPGLSDTARHSLTAEIEAAVTLTARRPGRRALQLYLQPWARVSAVRDGDGRPLPFLRHHIGARSSGIDRRIYDLSLIVLLDRPLEPGRLVELAFDYELDVTNYAPGRLWLPGAEHFDGGLTDLHTARLEITTRDAYAIRAMGRLVEESTERGMRTAVWEIDRPAKMITFAIARKVEEQTLEAQDLPQVVVFSPPLGHDTVNRLHDVGADVANSYAFFENLLGPPGGGERLYATLIQAFHGQAFDGFLHLPEASAFRQRTGPTERLLAHEVAHLWWGHRVGFAGYRDQWLSEGLAQYSALLYLEAALERGEELFREALKASRDEVLGSVGSSMSPFARQGLSLDNQAAQRRIGPVGHGRRAAVGEAPAAYATLAYRKAALVMHMLRALLHHAEGSDATFAAILRELARRHGGGHPATADFAALVTELAPGDWGWFFEQWIEGAEIPRYDWSAELPATAGPDGTWPVTLEIRQSEVPDGFRMLLPVRLELRDGGAHDLLVAVSGPETVEMVAAPGAVARVRVDPEGDLLARISGR